MYLISNRHNDVMEGSEVFSITHRVPVPGDVDVEALCPRPSDKLVVSIRSTRIELAVVVAMEGYVKDPTIKE